MKKKQKATQEGTSTAKVTKLKKSFFQRYAEETPKPFFKALRDDLCTSKGIIISIIVALLASILLLGPHSYTYSLANYDYILDTLFVGGYPVTDETGKDLQDAEGNLVLSPPAITEGEGIDIVALDLRLDRYTRNYDKQAGTNTLECAVKTGHLSFFDAKVTLVLDQNFSVLSSTQNFQSLQHYQIVFWMVFFLSTILGGIVVWFLSECGWYGLLALIRFFSKEKTSAVSSEQPSFPATDIVESQTA